MPPCSLVRAQTEAACSSCPRLNSLGLYRAHQGLRRSSIKAVVDADLQIHAQVRRHSLQRPSGEQDVGQVKLRGGLCRRVVRLSPWFPLHTSRAHMKRAPVFVYGTPRPSRTHCFQAGDLCYSNRTTSTENSTKKVPSLYELCALKGSKHCLAFCFGDFAVLSRYLPVLCRGASVGERTIAPATSHSVRPTRTNSTRKQRDSKSRDRSLGLLVI